MRRAFVLLALGLAGCGDPVIDGPLRMTVFEDHLWGRFEHTMEVVHADPGLGLEPGRTTAPAPIMWSQSEDHLFALALDGDPLRAIYGIEARVAVDREDPRRWRGPDAEPNALVVDWSRNLYPTFAAVELGLERIEPVAWFVQEDWEDIIAPVFLRDPETGTLDRIEVATRYVVISGDDTLELTVRDRFVRVSD